MTITVEGLDVHFGGLHALRDVSLTIPRGQVTALIGPNGAGKSTLVNAITGHIKPSNGRIVVGDQAVSSWPAHKRVSLGIARTFQTPRVKPEATLWENVVIGAYPRTTSGMLATVLGTPRHRRAERDAGERAKAALDRFGLRDDVDTHATDVPVWSLRLLEVARALAGEPSYVLLDEPAAGVDASARDQLGELIRSLATEGLGVLLIEHHFAFVRQVSDSVVVLDQGAVLAKGTAADIEKDSRVIDSYLGRAAHA